MISHFDKPFILLFSYFPVPVLKTVICKIIQNIYISSNISIDDNEMWAKYILQLSRKNAIDSDYQIDILMKLLCIHVNSEQEIKSLASISQTDFILTCLINQEFTQHRLDSFYDEISRLEDILKLEMINSRDYNIDPDIKEKMENKIFSVVPYEAQKETISNFISCFRIKLDFIAEKGKLFKDGLSIKEGHWFKCLKGHLYRVYGVATQISECPECKCKVGGSI